jgi:6-phosphogluconolactonase
VAVDPSGKFVFTGNNKSFDVSGFALASGSGALTALVPGPVRARKSPASLAVSSGTTAITYTPSYAFVADFEGGVPVLSVSSSKGSLTSVKGSPFGTGTPRAIAVSPNQQFVYTANADSSNTIGEYTVNTATGALTSVGTIACGDSPYSVAVDPSSRFVYAVAIDTDAVCAFAINATTGVLKAIAGSPFTADIVAPDSVAVDPTGRFLMVAEGCCADTAGITVYTITPATGKLTAVKGSPFLPVSGVSEPSAVIVDPTGRYVYVANGQAFGSGGATVYSINATSGKLTSIGSEIVGGSAPWDITTDVTGSYVYMTNNDSTIYAYVIANATGELSNVKGSPFSGIAPTRGIAADPSGKYLYVADSSQLLGYGINPSNGVLTVLKSSPYSAGFGPIDLTVGGTIK